MQEDGIDYLSALAVELVQEIAGNLNPKEVVHFALASKQTLFKVQRNLTLNKTVYMSTLVAYGKQAEAEQWLIESPNAQELLLTSVPFTDYSGRTFHCTAYEYAYWAKDTHMCRMLEQHMDENTKIQMLERCEAIEKHGLKYRQNGQECCTQHFDFAPLKKALNRYVQGYDNWYNTKDWGAMKAAWMEVGRAQRDAPVHVINEICRPDRSFDPTPEFDEVELPRVLTYYDREGQEKPVFPLVASDSSGLGVDFALIRASYLGASPCLWPLVCRQGSSAFGPDIDLAAVSRLDEVRAADLTQSRENLRSSEPEPSRGMIY